MAKSAKKKKARVKVKDLRASKDLKGGLLERKSGNK